MRKLIYTITLIMCIAFSCKENATDGEGIVTYSIQYPDDNPYRFKQVLPSKTDLVFKDKKACFITSAGMGMVKIVNILDNEERKFTSLFINNFGENLACIFTENELKSLESLPKYSFKETDEIKTIAGLTCNKAIVTDEKNGSTFDVYFYKKIKMYYGSSPFKDFQYLLMEYPHTINGLPMQLKADKIDFTAVDTNLFEVKGDFKWVGSKEFYSYIDGLRLGK